MGGLLSSSGTIPSTVIVDFNTPSPPTDVDIKKLYDQVEALQPRMTTAIATMESYSGCEELIRLAMSKPQDAAAQLSAFEGMFPNVNRIREFYQLGKDIDEVCGRLVRVFVEADSLGDYPALLKQFAGLLNFALVFDRCKMMRPAVQNDFSFYRRALGKNGGHKGIPVTEIEANNISMFIAQATPVIATLVITMDNLQRQIQVTNLLADFAHVCCANVMRDKTREQTSAKFAFTAMVVAIVIYDQISPSGAFVSSSGIQIRTCIAQLKILPTEDRGALCDALQYSTKTFNKAPESIKKQITSR